LITALNEHKEKEVEQFLKMGLRPKPRAGLPPPAASVAAGGWFWFGWFCFGWFWLVWTAVLG
jgi:hypothetical protein